LKTLLFGINCQQSTVTVCFAPWQYTSLLTNTYLDIPIISLSVITQTICVSCDGVGLVLILVLHYRPQMPHSCRDKWFWLHDERSV